MKRANEGHDKAPRKSSNELVLRIIGHFFDFRLFRQDKNDDFVDLEY